MDFTITPAGHTYKYMPEDVTVGAQISRRTFHGTVGDAQCIVKQVYSVDGSVAVRDLECFAKAFQLGIGPEMYVAFVRKDTIYFVMQRFSVSLSKLIALQRGNLTKKQVLQLVELMETLASNRINFKTISHTKVFWSNGRFCLVDFCYPNVCDRFDPSQRDTFVYKHVNALIMCCVNQRDLHFFLRSHANENGKLNAEPEISVASAMISREQRRRFKRRDTS